MEERENEDVGGGDERREASGMIRPERGRCIWVEGRAVRPKTGVVTSGKRV